MNKSILTVAVAALALAGCTKNETVDVADSNVIGFANAFVGNPTKAVTEVKSENINHFYALATKNDEGLFNNELVSKNGDSWTYDNLEQWEEATYTFAAYSNGGTATTGDVISTATWNGTTLTIPDYEIAAKDLIVSISSTNIDQQNQKVVYQFEHALSMIKFTIKSELGDGDNAIEISNFTVSGLKDKATLTYTTAGKSSWTVPAEDETLSNGAPFNVTTTTAGESDPFVVIPQAVTDITVSFTATIEGMEPKTLTAKITDVWEPGFRYNYIATITGLNMDIIQFNEPTVSGWDDTEWTTGIDTPLTNN